MEDSASEELMRILNNSQPKLDKVKRIFETHPGLDVNVDYGDGLPVFAPYMASDKGVFEFLCSKGMNLNITNDRGRTVLINECQGGFFARIHTHCRQH